MYPHGPTHAPTASGLMLCTPSPHCFRSDAVDAAFLAALDSAGLAPRALPHDCAICHEPRYSHITLFTCAMGSCAAVAGG